MGIVYPEGTGFVAVLGFSASKILEADCSLRVAQGRMTSQLGKTTGQSAGETRLAGFNGWNFGKDRREDLTFAQAERFLRGGRAGD